MAQSLTKEEKQLLKLCRNKDAPIREFTALLDKGGVRLNIHDKEGKHPLYLVSRRGRSDLADLFLNHGAEVDLATNDDKFGDRAFIIASHEGHLETVKLLLYRGASVNSQRKDGFTALYFSSKNNHVEVVKFLLNSGAQVNKGSQTPLYATCAHRKLNAAKVLLDHGADVNQPTDGKPHSSPLGAACEHNHPQVALLLINHGANINYQEDYGNTPLHWASKNGHTKVANILVQSQASINVKNKLGNTPLHRAVKNRHIEIVRLLLLSQANMEIKNNAGKTPLQLAEDKNYSKIANLLKTGVPAQPEGVSASDEIETISVGEAGDGEEPGEVEQPSVEELTGEQKTDDHSRLAVLSGHILTKDELQVLHALLASYSGDKLKSLQLSLQEEQEIRDIPLEEVETSLRQSGLDTMADRLRNNLEKGTLVPDDIYRTYIFDCIIIIMHTSS